jgi:hypothetical protein
VLGADVLLQLTMVSAAGGMLPGSVSRLESIEKIDLTGSGDNTLKLTASDVLDLAGMNSFNVNLAAVDALHQLMVNGSLGDMVELDDSGWLNTGTFVDGGLTYQVWTDEAQRAQLLISPHITVIGG